MKPITLDDVICYLTGEICDEAERSRVEQARRNDPQVARWFELLDDSTVDNKSELTDDETDVSPEAMDTLRTECKILAASQWMLMRVEETNSVTLGSDGVQMRNFRLRAAGMELDLNCDSRSVVLRAVGTSDFMEPQSLLLLRPSTDGISPMQELREVASQEDIRALVGWATDVVPLAAVASPEVYRGWFRNSKIRQHLLNGLARVAGTALMVRMSPLRASALDKGAPGTSEAVVLPGAAEELQRTSPTPSSTAEPGVPLHWLSRALYEAGLVRGDDSQLALHLVASRESDWRRYPVLLSEVLMQTRAASLRAAGTTCKVTRDWLATRLTTLFEPNVTTRDENAGTDDARSLEGLIRAAAKRMAGRTFLDAETRQLIWEKGLQVTFVEHIPESSVARLTITTRSQQLKQALIGCAFLDHDNRELRERAFVVLHETGEHGWLVGEADFNAQELYNSLFTDGRKPRILVCRVLNVTELSVIQRAGGRRGSCSAV